MDVFIKNLLINNDYENSVCLLNSSLMKFVIKSIGDMDLKMETAGNFQLVNLPWTNVSFICIENFLKDYEKFAPNEKMTRYFPMHMNYEEFYNMNILPQLEYFQFLSDSNEVLEEKEMFWKNIKAINKWNFMDQMKLYLFNRAEKLLEATVKLSKLSYEIQHLLRNHYAEKHRYPVGSIFRCFGVNSFMYLLFIHYSTVVLEKPIYCFDFEEKGISDFSCSKKEFEFQNFWRWKLPSTTELFGSYISPRGAKKFDKFQADVYDATNKIIYNYNGCYHHS